ncbi:Helix-turn-helix domain-containing protein [Poseidonocella pacifica]|uniref:Helix-turn-helix domain-containing protein n=1 Tax=Poseidonocella pacifica TaxID=871651 RepID=A0A1I0YHP1_9RHOB|nr:helix-turn-helix domain-containing protein [Poseidonocella pacifica]SFB12844.1 Helix-turn-helix domain-containing protein [Poseidonocella pacifica]
MTDDHKRLMSRTEVADVYGIGRRFLETAALRGDGPSFVRIGRLVRYRAKDVEAWIDANCVSTEVQ